MSKPIEPDALCIVVRSRNPENNGRICTVLEAVSPSDIAAHVQTADGHDATGGIWRVDITFKVTLECRSTGKFVGHIYDDITHESHLRRLDDFDDFADEEDGEEVYAGDKELLGRPL